jgi:hypothetical protein
MTRRILEHKIKVSQYSDWIQSPHSERVWLEDSMTTLGQYAFVNPLHRLKHWNPQTKKRVDCWHNRGKECFLCNKGASQIHDYTYGIYISKENKVKYLSVNLSTHSHFQRIFSTLFDDNINPCDTVFEFTKKQITNFDGKVMNGYDIVKTEEEMFVAEIFRPSPLSPSQNKIRKFKWAVPEELINKIVKYDGKPFNLIDLFLLLKDKAPRLNDTTAKSYAVKLLENGVVDIRKAKEYRH